MRKLRYVLNVLLTLVLIVGVASAVYLSVREQLGETLAVRGMIGSEKEDFFRDPRVIAALKNRGLEVRVEKSGSRQIATLPNLKEFDFAFPSGVPAAEKIRREQGGAKSFQVFYSPMAVASWEPIADLLTANGIVSKTGEHYYISDMARLLDLCRKGARWADLKANQAYRVNKGILIGTTDLRYSNSAAMYLALASYVVNHNDIVSGDGEADAMADALAPLFLRQGFQESSSAGPFNDYLVMGLGKAPLVMIYEAQFLAEAARANGGLNEGMVLLYPQPTLFTKHVLISFTEGGERLGTALMEDPELQKLAIEHGFRNTDTKSFRAFVESRKLAVPEMLVDVIEAPGYELLERMIQRVEQSSGGARP